MQAATGLHSGQLRLERDPLTVSTSKLIDCPPKISFRGNFYRGVVRTATDDFRLFDGAHSCSVLITAALKVLTLRLRLKCDETRAETIFRLPAKRTSPFKSAGASVQSTTCSRGVSISGSNAGYTMFRGSVKGTGYQIYLLVSPSLPLSSVTVCHHVSTGLY